MGAVPVEDPYRLAVPGDGQAGGLHHQLVGEAVGRRGDDAPLVDLADQLLPAFQAALLFQAGGLGLETQNFLPPSYAQYKKINPYPYNLGKAKELVRRSGTKGDHVDLYTAGDYLFWPSAGEYLQGVLASLGYDVQLHEVAGG